MKKHWPNHPKKSIIANRHTLVGVLFICGISLLSGVVWAKDFQDSDTFHITYPHWFKSGILQLDEFVTEAKAGNKKGLMILFTNEGCSYCSAFIKRSLGDEKIAATVKKYFDSVGLEIFDDNEFVTPAGEEMRIKHFAKRERAEFSPTLLFYDTDGKLMLRVIGYQSPQRFRHILNFIIEDHYRRSTLAEYFNKLAHADKTPAKLTANEARRFEKSRPLLEKKSSQSGKPLLIVFEKPGCTECDDFQSKVLMHPPINAKLKKFQLAHVDVTDNRNSIYTPDGRKTTGHAWYKKTGFSRVPALLFYNESRQQVLSTDALVLQQRMTNSLNYVLEKSYEKQWNYQRFARSKAIQRSLNKNK